MSLLTSFLEVVNHLQNRGELLKAYSMLLRAPSSIEDEVAYKIAELKVRIKDLSEMQTYGTVGGKFNAGFIDPEDKEKIVKYKLLKEFVTQHNLKKLVDIGCFTGWIGRGLAPLGIAVHGIDVHPVIIQLAAFAASGSLATFEYLPVQKLGYTHLKEYDGVILFDVLEHCFDPNLAIESCEKSLKNEGYMIINLPSVEGEMKANLHPLDQHEHLYSFSKKKINELFSRKKEVDIKEIINEGNILNWFITYKV